MDKREISVFWNNLSSGRYLLRDEREIRHNLRKQMFSDLPPVPVKPVVVSAHKLEVQMQLVREEQGRILAKFAESQKRKSEYS